MNQINIHGLQQKLFHIHLMLSIGGDRRWDLGDVGIGEAVTIYITDSISTAVTVGDNIQLTASFYGTEDDCDGSDNVYVDNQEAVGAIDPNDITVTPEGYIDNDQDLTYKIRFQNVGNAMVSTVRVEDRLPAGLDVNTIQLGLTSHNYRFEIEDGNRLVWTFDNINMPDSLTDEANSHGYILFKIKPTVGLEDGNIIENKVSIFFDNVAPIETNTVINIIGEEPREVVEGEQLQIFPNPMIDQSTIQISPLEGGEINIVKISVFDMLGKKVYERFTEPGTTVVMKKWNLSMGYFIVKAVGENGKNYSGKVLITEE